MNSLKLIHKKYHWKQVSSMVILCLLLGCGVEKYIPEGKYCIQEPNCGHP